MGFLDDNDRGVIDAEAARAHAAAAGLRVDRENVLKVRTAILDEHDKLQTVLDERTARDMTGVRPYGGDPVSQDAAVAFPALVTRLVGQVRSQLAEFEVMAANLEAAARAYGYSEEEIRSSVRGLLPVAGVASLVVDVSISAALNPGPRA